MKTTINVRRDRYLLLKDAACVCQIPYSRLIKSCLYRYAAKNRIHGYCLSTIRYQPQADVWETVPFCLSQCEYERYLCMKATLKLSFSFLVSIAIDQFLETITNELKHRNSKHSYILTVYKISIQCDESFTYVTYSWKNSRKRPKKTITLRL